MNPKFNGEKIMWKMSNVLENINSSTQNQRLLDRERNGRLQKKEL